MQTDVDADARRIAALLSFAEELREARDADTILQALADAARAAVGAAGVRVHLYAENGGSPLVVTVVNAGFRAPVALSADDAAVRRAWTERRAIWSPQSTPAERRGDGHAAATVVVPLAVGADVLGWIGAQFEPVARSVNPPGPAEERVLAALAAQGSLALDRVELDARHRRACAQARDADACTAFAMAMARAGTLQVEPSGRIECTAPLLDLLGLRREQLAGGVAALCAHVHANDRDALQHALQTALRTGGQLDVDFRIAAGGEAVRSFHLKGRTLPGAGEPAPLVCAVIDVTPLRSIEDQLRQAQKMEAIGQLAGGVAHDFNNLLTAILGYSGFLAEGLGAPEERKDAEQIIRAGERAAALTRQLLAFSRRQVSEPKVSDLNALVTNIVGLLRRVIGEHIEVVTTLGNDVGSVRVDPAQIEQVIMNLAVNARDALPSGGTIEITTSRVQLGDDYPNLVGGPAVPGRYSRLRVSDDGVGMDDGTIARIFEPFFTTKEPGKGSGLGLATVYGIVTQSRGYLAVTSNPGKGTAFDVFLPEAPVDSPLPVAAARPEPAKGGHETILVVEDEHAVRALSRLILERAGYRVIEAATSEDAHALLARADQTVDLLVTDVVMPGASGPELYAARGAARADLRVLYTSGYASDSASIAAALAGGANFLQKPFTAQALVKKVREILDR